ncbi:MAG: tetratricopeptide repeat protein, partial [Actinobacteria bacterium]|nr:tetratricopeptide repeat protein [Actinomycetota bacterium]
QALALHQQIGDRAGEAATRANLASIDVEQGDYAAARAGFQQALAIRQQIGDRAGEAATRHQLASIDLRQGDYAAARAGFQQALAIRQQIGDRAGEAATFFQLGVLAEKLGRPAAGVRLVGLCYLIDRSISHRDAPTTDWNALTAKAARLGYTQDKLDELLRTVSQAHATDRGHQLVLAAFGDDAGEAGNL